MRNYPGLWSPGWLVMEHPSLARPLNKQSPLVTPVAPLGADLQLPGASHPASLARSPVSVGASKVIYQPSIPEPEIPERARH